LSELATHKKWQQRAKEYYEDEAKLSQPRWSGANSRTADRYETAQLASKKNFAQNIKTSQAQR
jgi:hypothetical protein